MSNGRTSDSLPALICRPMQLWLGVIGIGYIIVHYFPKWWGAKLFSENGQVFGNREWYHAGGAIILLFTFILNASQPRPQPMDVLRVLFIIVLSIVLLCLAVFLTGGFTDSPFSGAVALYIGFFMILAKQPEFRLANYLFVLITIVLLGAPYVHLFWQGYAELNILHWHDKPPVLWGRWAISIAILLIAALVGERISSRVSTTKGLNYP